MLNGAPDCATAARKAGVTKQAIHKTLKHAIVIYPPLLGFLPVVGKGKKLKTISDYERSFDRERERANRYWRIKYIRRKALRASGAADDSGGK